MPNCCYQNMRNFTILVVISSLLIPLSVYGIVEISDNSIIGLWHMDGDSTDASGFGRNGTDTSIDYVGAKLSSGALSNASGDVINLPTWSNSSSLGISFWVSSTDTDGRMTSFVAGDGNKQLWSRLFSSKASVGFYSGEIGRAHV